MRSSKNKGREGGKLKNQIKAVGTEKQLDLKKEYDEQLENGTEIKIRISLEADNYNELDYEETLSRIADSSHNFYLHVAKNI